MDSPMEQREPIPQVSEALSIIKDATETSTDFVTNKRQSTKLADYLRKIGEALQDSGGLSSDAGLQMTPNSSIDQLLTVLRRAKDLLSNSRSQEAIFPIVLGRAENRDLFRDIHGDLDMFKSMFYIEDFDYASESKKNATLIADADEDRKELLRIGLQELEANSVQLLQSDLETAKAKLVVMDKISSRDLGRLPTYLTIDPNMVQVGDPIRLPEGISKSEVSDGVMVHHASYLGCSFASKLFGSSHPEWLKEVHSLMELHHPHIVQIIGFAQNEQRCMILMELMQDDLRYLMRKGRRFTHSEGLDIIYQIAKAMYYLHEQQYVHGELKCSNILVQSTGDHVEVRISDLRSSHKLGSLDPVLLDFQRSRPRWTAPEVKNYVKPGVTPTSELLKKADIYSFGMVCYEVLTGNYPFHGIKGEDLEKRIEDGLLKQELPANVNGNLKGLIEKCWESDPNARPTFEGICHQLEFIRTSSSFSWDALGRKLKTLPRETLNCLNVCGGKESEEVVGANESEEVVGAKESEEVVGASRDILPEFVRIPPADLKLGGLLGTGAYGEVYEGTWLGCTYAVKKTKVYVDRPPFEQVQAQIEGELTVLIQLRHPSIVRLMGVSLDPAHSTCSIIMERMDGDLTELMKSRKPFDVREAVHIIRRIALGMLFLHFRGVVHGDLKGKNVLVPLNSNRIDVKISDFGTTQFIDGRDWNVRVGTAFWRAPEILLRAAPAKPGEQPPTLMDVNPKAADVYGFAMTCFEIVTGTAPFQDELVNPTMPIKALQSQVIEQGLRPKLPSGLNADLRKLVVDCWDGEPEKRPTFFQICQRLEYISQGLQ